MTTEITVKLYPSEVEELLYEQRESVEWRGNLPVVIKTDAHEQEISLPYKINVVIPHAEGWDE